MGRTEVHGKWVYEVERDPSGSCQWHTVSSLPPASAASIAASRTNNDTHNDVLASRSVDNDGGNRSNSSSSSSNSCRRNGSRWSLDILSKPVVAVIIVGLAVALSSSQPSMAVRTALGVLISALVLRLAVRRLFSLGVKHQVTVLIVEGLGVQIEVAQVTITQQKRFTASNSSNHSGSSTGSNNVSSSAMADSQPRVVHRQLVPLDTIAAAVITEIVTPTSCHFALVLLLADSDQPLPVFRVRD
ncbi:unnamed protein product [Closterium sp. NIES-54]